MTEVQAPIQVENLLFTCLSCSIAFLTAEEQRNHYRSDHHRYNMKRRVASLPPVSAAVFNQKVVERRQETAVAPSPKGLTCEICNKVYTTENAYRSHILSRKHREAEVRALSRGSTVTKDQTPRPPTTDVRQASQTHTISESPNENDLDDGGALTLDEKIATARSRHSPVHCLFCARISSSLEDNLTHMSAEHSFFIPDAEYLVDPTGLVSYLGDKIAVGNVCIYCNGKGREFHTLDAVRKHMIDKSHCKIAYDTEDDMLEISDYYDFSSSYPDAEERRKRKEERNPKKAAAEAAEGWEDVDGSGGEVDEVVDEPPSEETSDEDEESDTDSLPENQITFGDSHLELVLPSGNRIGHRSMRRYYAQSFSGGKQAEDHNSGRAIVRRLLADKNSALVPRKAGFGAFGAGTEVIKARNRGEAREAGRHIREFRDQKRKEDYRTRVAFVHNNQKHYRDPLLQ
ncbi:C2H2 type zinc-finger-domain-containing protein [Multifurca ochricompacta]|uniref:C2H2 type zinc-finger-domain-containing protein n=1 Tax=Multifurca ochricompacta TaxID=376703 RepID=A0AAD4QQM1_9AGAM|nr:C2H2 type zinc-finger-domain-containing protein [Multifurca ochricompacta]